MSDFNNGEIVDLMADRVREKYKTRPALIEEMQALLVQC